MRKQRKKLWQILLLSFCMLFCLFFPEISKLGATRGLLQWYQNILPVLFPFMILTSLLRLLELDSYFGDKMNFLFRFFSKFSATGHYIMFLGFLCGFPMGAKLVHDAYRQHKISRKEAMYLLGFCNNLSPAFFIGVVFPIMQSLLVMSPNSDTHILLHAKTPYLLCMYGVPLCYGLLIQYHLPKNRQSQNLAQITKPSDSSKALCFVHALDVSLTDNILPIVKLGCYIMIFQICSLVPTILFQKLSLPQTELLTAVSAALLEITNGTLLFRSCHQLSPALTISLLFFLQHFGGLSCLMQTNAFMADTDWSMPHYIFQKCIIGTASAICFLLFYYGQYII